MSGKTYFGEPTIQCRWCGEPTTGGFECDSCWTIRTAVERNPTVARRIINAVILTWQTLHEI